MYTTNNVEACYHCAADSHCNIFVVEDEKQLAKVLQFRDKVPSLKAVVQYSGDPSSPGVISWTQLMEMGAKEDSHELQRRIKRVRGLVGKERWGKMRVRRILLGVYVE